MLLRSLVAQHPRRFAALLVVVLFLPLVPVAAGHTPPPFSVSAAGLDLEGGRISLAFRLESDINLGRTLLLAVADGNGVDRLRLEVRAVGATLSASDGEAFQPLPLAPINTWRRVDVTLRGTTYEVSLDGGAVSTFALRPGGAPATLHGRSGGSHLDLAKLRILAPQSAQDATFAQGGDGFLSRTVTAGSISTSATGAAYNSLGYAALVGSGAAGGVAYFSAPVGDLGAQYTVEAGFAPVAAAAVDLDNVPRHVAVVAGLGSGNQVRWAITVAGVGPLLGLFYVNDAGDAEFLRHVPSAPSTQSYGQFTWYDISAHVDEDAGTLAVFLAGRPVGPSFAASVAGTERIATGDVFTGTIVSGAGRLLLDEVWLVKGFHTAVAP